MSMRTALVTWQLTGYHPLPLLFNTYAVVPDPAPFIDGLQALDGSTLSPPCLCCRCVRFNFDNSQVLSSGADAKVILWDWRSRTAARIFSGHFISVGACDIAFQVSKE
jgi:WD40 repeat protein